MMPTPDLTDEGVIRLYLGFCDERTVSRIAFIDVDVDDPLRVLTVCDKPVLDIGTPGAFDDNGVLPSCIVSRGNVKCLYYVGFQLGVKVRYCLLSGLAQSFDGGRTYERYSAVPVLERCVSDLFFRTAPFVMFDEGIWKMWYVGGGSWTEVRGKMLPIYRMKYLESEDGLNWRGEGVVCMDFENEDEHGFGRPFVMKDNGSYEMLYSIRSRSRGYRLGYAQSQNGKTWTRKDEDVGIDVSPNGWDSRAICYASIVKVGEKMYMFYNGNDFGETGVGFALLDQIT
jgi:predicted GH43/DUF377 family glycosyl hydrolase